MSNLNQSAAEARDSVLRIQQWAATLQPSNDPRVQKLLDSLLQTRGALEVLMVAK